jgi:IMP dehydrogenase/GMP reductase
MKNKLFDFDDILIEPCIISNISSRKEIKIRNENGMLPIFTAPMDTVISNDNVTLYEKNGIMPVLPRTIDIDKDYYSTSIFYSYSIQDFEKVFLNNTIKLKDNEKAYALVDVANGHMRLLYELAKEAKKKYGDSLCLMIGNVANPKTFLSYCQIGVDIIRIGIGNGNGCLTTVQTGVGYPMASLIKECADVKYGYNTKIVADGGFKKYADIIKALALGADYVMLGSLLNKALESAGETTTKDGMVINQYSEITKTMYNADVEYFKTFRGMSTKEVQQAWGKESLTTSEGIVRTNKVEYTLEGWVINFEDYLKSAMSYTGKKELHDFIGGVDFNFISHSSFKRFDK